MLLESKIYLLLFIISKQNGYPLTILKLTLYSQFESLFVHVTYAIYIINVFHTVRLTLRTITSIDNIQKMNQKKLGTRKLLEADFEKLGL